VAILCLALVLIFRPSGKQGDFDREGPLEVDSDLGVGCAVKHPTFYFGGIVLKNRGSEALILDDVELFDASDALELLGSQAAGPHRLFDPPGKARPRRIAGFICHRNRRRAPPVSDRGPIAGTEVPPLGSPGARRGVELLLRMRLNRRQTLGFRGVTVSYSRAGQDGDDGATLESAFWVCMREKVVTGCKIPGWAYGRGHP
jgi:hypothetical protein